MTDKLNWKIREQVIALLEQHLGPDAKVEHNIDLPVLKSKKGRTRQCDVVITQGKEPRRTVSIAEVQKRGAKPDINTFNGWVEKKNEVGAQHLLCISEIGFPSSIQERAEELGPTVRLLTIKELEKEGWPIPPTYFSSELKRVRYDELLGLQWEHIHLVRRNTKKKQDLPDPFQKLLKFDNDQLLSVSDLMDIHLFKTDKHLDSLPIKENISLRVQFAWQTDEAPSIETEYQGWVKIKWLKVDFRLSIFLDEIKWATESYQQYNWGDLAWCLTGTTDSGLHVVVPLHQEKPGNYRLGRLVSLDDKEMQAFMSVDSRGYKSIKFDL